MKEVEREMMREHTDVGRFQKAFPQEEKTHFSLIFIFGIEKKNFAESFSFLFFFLFVDPT
jgi:hypothetical protein